MRIGIDFDNTIVNTKETVNMFMEKYNVKGFKTEEEKTEFYRKYVDDMMNYITLKDNVIDVLNRLKKNHELYIITARSDYYSSNLVELTKKYIKDHNIPIDNVYFYNFVKSEISKKLKIDIFIDDDIDVVKDLTQNGIKVLIFDNEYEGTKRVNNWLEVEKEVELWMKE